MKLKRGSRVWVPRIILVYGFLPRFCLRFFHINRVLVFFILLSPSLRFQLGIRADSDISSVLCALSVSADSSDVALSAVGLPVRRHHSGSSSAILCHLSCSCCCHQRPARLAPPLLLPLQCSPPGLPSVLACILRHPVFHRSVLPPATFWFPMAPKHCPPTAASPSYRSIALFSTTAPPYCLALPQHRLTSCALCAISTLLLPIHLWWFILFLSIAPVMAESKVNVQFNDERIMAESNLVQVPTILLTMDNYLTWSATITIGIAGQGKYDYIAGLLPLPV